MKKLVYLSAIVAAGLGSCAQNEIESVPALAQDNAIGFSAYSGETTRGIKTNIDRLKNTGFGVYGYYHAYKESMGINNAGWHNEKASLRGADFMKNTRVAYDESPASSTIGNWSYFPLKYWTNNTKDRTSFVAYGPHVELDGDGMSVPVAEEGILSIDKGVTYPQFEEQLPPVIEYKLHASPKDMIDLVGATAFNQAKIADDRLENSVGLEFQHLMTRVKVSAILAAELKIDKEDKVADETYAVITSLKFVGPNSQLINKDGQVEKGKSFYTDGIYEFYTPAKSDNRGTIGGWRGLVAATDDYDLNQGDFLNFEHIEGVNQYNKDGFIVTEEEAPVFKDNHALYLLPPNGEEGLCDGQSVKMYVEYDVITKDADLPNGGRHVTTNRDIVDFAPGTLKMGTAYNVLLRLGINSVDMNPSVENWAKDEFTITTPNDVTWKN